MDKIKNYLWLIGLLTFLGGVVGYIYNQGVKETERETRMFKDAFERVQITTKVSELPSPEQMQRKYFQDSIRTAQLMRKDSIATQFMKMVIEKDSLSRLNADQIYQMKIEVQDLVKEVKNMH